MDSPVKQPRLTARSARPSRPRPKEPPMPSKKLHTAFVSCPTELREERRAVLDVLLSFDAFPISTEFFTIQSKDAFATSSS